MCAHKKKVFCKIIMIIIKLKWYFQKCFHIYFRDLNLFFFLFSIKVLILCSILKDIRHLASNQWCVGKYLTPATPGGAGGIYLIYRICQFAWWKYSYHGWFQATNMMSHVELERNTIPQRALAHLYLQYMPNTQTSFALFLLSSIWPWLMS